MFSLYRSCSNPIKRSAHLGIWYVHRIAARPLLIQTFQYTKSKDKDGGKDKLNTTVDAKADPKNKSVNIKSADASSTSKGKPSSSADKPSSSADKGPQKDKGKAVVADAGPPKIEIRIVPAMYPSYGYDEKNMMMGRQLSPHLSIYKIQLTSMLSILLRISGFVLAVGIWIIGLSALFRVNFQQLAKKIEKCDCSDIIFKSLKFCLVLPLAYHAVAGTRHLIWYLNVFLSMPHVYATGYAAIALSLILATGLTFVNVDAVNKEPSYVSYDGNVEVQTINLSEYDD